MNGMSLKRVFPLLLVFGMLNGCVPTSNEYDTLRAQVTQHDQVLSQLNNQVSGVQPAQADTWAQVQSLRQEIAALRGDMDTVNMALSQTGGAAGMADLLARHDRALRLIETQLAMDLQLGQPAGGATPMGATSGFGQPAITPVVTQPPLGTGSTPVVSAPGADPVTDAAQALYDAGMASFNNRRYDQGLKSFADFTEAYPQHNLASNAWFWQGECHYQLQNYAAAALAYEQVISRFANSNKAPDAYFKQGMSFIHLDKKDAAKERLNQLIQKFPRSPFATRAQQEIANNKL